MNLIDKLKKDKKDGQEVIRLETVISLLEASEKANSLKEQLQKVGENIKQEIVKGNYEVVNVSDNKCTADIVVQGIRLCVWIANEPKDNFRVYDDYQKFKMSEYINFTSQKDRIKAFRKMREYLKDNDKKLKADKIASLKKELQELQN